MKFSMLVVAILMMFSTGAFGKWWSVRPCKMTYTDLGLNGGGITTGSGVGCRATLNFRVAQPGGGPMKDYGSLQEYLAEPKLTLKQKAVIEKKYTPLFAKLNGELRKLAAQKFSKQADFDSSLKKITSKYAKIAPEIQLQEMRE